MTVITQERLKQLLNFNPETDEFTRKTTVGSRKAGTKAGTIARNGYVNIVIDRRSYLGHRLAWLWMTGNFPVNEVDHINHARSDNRWVNLRDVPRSVNHENRVNARKGSKTGVLGVRYSPRRHHFFSEIKVDGRYLYLGSFKTLEEARAAYLEAKRKHHNINEVAQ